MIEITATGDTTLHTAGKYCAEDILVKVPAGSGDSGGSTNVEYETITIPAGATSATYSLSRVTGAYGCITEDFGIFARPSTEKFDYESRPIISIRDNTVVYINTLYAASAVYAITTIDFELFRGYIGYGSGIISFYDGELVEPIELTLVNDPNATAISI